MLLKGHLNSNKTEILIESYAKLLNEGIDAAKILVIVENSKKSLNLSKKQNLFLKLIPLQTLTFIHFLVLYTIKF